MAGKGKDLVELSEQQMINCAENAGCLSGGLFCDFKSVYKMLSRSGTMLTGYNYAMQKGLPDLETVPYTNGVREHLNSNFVRTPYELFTITYAQEGACHHGAASAVKIIKFVEIDEEDEDELEAIVERHPVAAAIHLPSDMQFYSSGVYENDDCPTRCDERRVS